jgi:hypothetical protein
MIISGVMAALGLFVLGRLVMQPDQPLTGTRVLDLAFGLFFVARGAVYFWTVRRRARG